MLGGISGVSSPIDTSNPTPTNTDRTSLHDARPVSPVGDTFGTLRALGSSRQERPDEKRSAVNFSTTPESSLPTTGNNLATSVCPRVLDRQKLWAEFVTVKQTEATSVEEMDHADEAAFQEAIARSLQEKTFGILVKPESQPPKRCTIPASDRTTSPSQLGIEKQPSEVSESNRERQIAGFAEPNNAFREHLDKHDLRVISNPGSGNNCAIYALVQQVRPDLTPDGIKQEVVHLRDLYDLQRPSDKGKMLFLDTGAGGAANALIGLVNQRYDVNLQVGVVEAGMDEAYPVTSREPISALNASASFTHRLAIWDQQGHYEAVTAKPDNQRSVSAEVTA